MSNLTIKVDPTEAKWIKFWIEQNNKQADSFLMIMLLSIAPFLGVIFFIMIVFAILCCILKLLSLYNEKKKKKMDRLQRDYLNRINPWKAKKI